MNDNTPRDGDEQALSPCVEGAAAAATTEACISALRSAVDAAAAAAATDSTGRGGTGEGVIPRGPRESSGGPLGQRGGLAESAAEVARREDGLRTLGSFVHDTALLEGAVDGVERGGQGGAVMSDGAAAGVFVKASWLALTLGLLVEYLQAFPGVRAVAASPPGLLSLLLAHSAHGGLHTKEVKQACLAA